MSDQNKERSRVAFNDIIIVEGSNSRKTYTNIEELAASMDENGMISDLVVRETGADKEGKRKYPLVAGHRRYKAIELLRDPEWSPKDKNGKKLPRKTTPASWAQVGVKKVKGNTQQQAVLNLVENLQRENLDPLEEAQAMADFIETYKATQAELAHKLGKSEPYISQRLSLLKNTAAEVKDALEKGEVSPTQVREIVTLPKAEQREVLAKIQEQQAGGKKMSVEAVKDVADKAKTKLGIKRDKPAKKKAHEPDYDNDKVAVAKEIYEGKEIDMRPKTAILEQLGALNERLKKPNISDETKAKTKNYIAALEFAASLRDSL
jgi:ParB-like chromosome segregation protein Spo0J